MREGSENERGDNENNNGYELQEYLKWEYVQKTDESPNFRANVVPVTKYYKNLFLFLGETTIDNTKCYKYILLDDSEYILIATPVGINKYKKINVPISNEQPSELFNDLINEIKGISDDEINKYSKWITKDYRGNDIENKFERLINFLKKYRRINQ